MYVKKRNNSKEVFDIGKVKKAVSKAFKSCDIAMPDYVLPNLESMTFLDEETVESIQDKVEDYLMDVNKEVAKAFILYREQHKQARFVRKRIDYMDKYSQSNDNAATSSETDANANVVSKNVANLEGEVYKVTNRTIQRQRMKEKLDELYPNEGLGKQYIEDLESNIIYQHDESSTPTLKKYTYSPNETIEVKYGDLHLLASLQTIYNEILCKEVLTNAEDGVWCKYPTNLYVRDKDGWTKITRLTRKIRHRDLVRVKTAFGEDIIVTDNHPMIIGEDKNLTKVAIESLGEKQLRLKNNIEFDGIEVLDLATCVECAQVYSNFITTRESKNVPYYYAKRFIKLDRALGYVVGFFIGDGNYDNTYDTLLFTQKEKATLDKLAENLFESFGVVSYSNQHSGSNPEIWVMKVCSRIVEQVFRNVFKIKDKAENKCLPYNLPMFNENFAKGIIEGLIDSDGTVQNNGATISIRLSSRECITQLTKLLRYFGYGVANTHQSTPFGNNVKIQSNYDIWGVYFTKTPNAVSLDNSYKYQKEVNRSIDKGLKYSLGWASITNVQKIENGSFLDKCNYIYDITTETNTFDCNNLWVHNCEAVSLYPLMLEGVGNIDKVTPTPPNDIQSFSGQITNLTFLLSSQCKGAVAEVGYFVALNYYVIKEFGTQWYNKLDVVFTNEHTLHSYTIKNYILKGMKQYIYGINQAAGNRSYNSPFTNVSWFDKYYFKAMYGEFYYPDGTKPKWEAIDTLQRMFMKLMRDIRLIKPVTFPVTTMSLLYDEDTKEFKDKEYAELCAEEWAKGGSFFCYMNSNPSSLASCCRVLSDMDENTFSSTTGMNGEMTGSCNVLSINLNRTIQNWAKAITGYKEEEELKSSLEEYLIAILDRMYKYQIAYKTMLYEVEDKHMFADCDAQYIRIKKLYSTIGVIGYMEAAEFLGIKINNNYRYKDFLSFIFSVISEQNKKHSINDKKRPFKFNLEAIPGEGLGVKWYEKDKEDGYVVTSGRERYSCYFFNPWDKSTNVLDKIKLHGGKIAKALSGGQAAHINVDSHLSKEQYLQLMSVAAKEGCNYFTFNIPMSECKECGHIVNAPIKECPKCKSKNIKYYTRTIGYLTAVDNWSSAMQKEFTQRIFTDKTIDEINA